MCYRILIMARGFTIVGIGEAVFDEFGLERRLGGRHEDKAGKDAGASPEAKIGCMAM